MLPAASRDRTPPSALTAEAQRSESMWTNATGRSPFCARYCPIASSNVPTCKITLEGTCGSSPWVVNAPFALPAHAPGNPRNESNPWTVA
jgi:hypothetical protein